MALSIYASLKGDCRKFRLLILEPSTDRFAPVRCKLTQSFFDECGLKYTALSYVWADPPGTTPIIVNGVETQITLNLEAALRHIRQPSCAAVLWVDALCINQEDLAEKNHQVEMMREIYSGAELVVAWLGSAREDSDLAMELLGKDLVEWKTSEETSECKLIEEEGPGYPSSLTINGEQGDDTPARICEGLGELTTPPAQSAATTSCLQPSSPGALTRSGATCTVPVDENEHQDERHIIDQPSPSLTSQSSSTSSGSSVKDSESYWEDFTEAIQRLSRRGTQAILKLLKRRWWYRVWVVQEVMLAKKVVFKCGDAEVSGSKMNSWGICLHVFQQLSDEHETTGSISSPMHLLTDLNKLKHLTCDAEFLLFAYGMREATRPHDHIYGLMGLMSARDRRLLGAPDYGCRVEDLFIDVATKIMEEHNSLELLLAAGIPKLLTEESSTKMNLPSWVPDWTRLSLRVVAYQYPDSRLDSLALSVFQFSEDMKELTFHGFELDKIESVKPIPALAQGEIPIWQSALVNQEGTRGDRRPPSLQGLVVAMFSMYSRAESLDNEEEFQLFASFFRELKEYRISLGRYEASGDHDNSDYLAGFLDWIGETRDGRNEKEILEKTFSVESASSFAAWYHRQSSAELQRLYMAYSLTRNGAGGTAGCSMFRTCKGSFGVMEARAAAGDLLCAVPDCKVPLVLRKFGSSKYLLVGPSHPIAGTTNGELARAVGNSKITKESFTLV
ncbi:hypothetical protein INS49_015673 [Diaporthe citri]|uniref:uncharacterized protein n=1 Tax=Diaporthe citri TaxID=83186 RepID=UPI001C7F7FEC|nr:uncharacterized protein INS49_015673 [Diaporthe citri]KAG6356286.1 hypothetical protein INS49_015673 [Diaporthe citri]